MTRDPGAVEEPENGSILGAPPHRAGRGASQIGRLGWGIGELLTAIRWTGLSLSVIAMVVSRPTRQEVVGAGVLVVYAVLRTVVPLRLEATGGRAALDVSIGVALASGIAGWTGLAASPYLLSVGADLLLAGLVAGAGAGIAVAAAAGTGVLVSWATGGLGEAAVSGGPQRAGLLALIAILGAYCHWLLRPERDDQAIELERLQSLTEVNTLLLELHARAASLPGAISLRGVVATTVGRLRDLLHPQVVVLLLRDPTAAEGGRPWAVAVAEGVLLPESMADTDLPGALSEAARSFGALRRATLAPGEGIGDRVGSGLYIPLWARETLVGLLAVERSPESPTFAERDLDVVADVAQHAGLAIDNARWFRRLRTLGAEEERGRIARELHDRVGQSLAFVALSLDRVAGEVGATTSAVPLTNVHAELLELAKEVRGATAEIREKLSDLRTDTSEETDLVAALGRLLGRIEDRSGIATRLEHAGTARLAPIVEREVWRIAQEAINNAERHAAARSITVRWRCDDDTSELEVVDDGKGMAATAPLRRDAYGILGMRERADAIGASLALSSPPDAGTIVRLRIDSR